MQRRSYSWWLGAVSFTLLLVVCSGGGATVFKASLGGRASSLCYNTERSNFPILDANVSICFLLSHNHLENEDHVTIFSFTLHNVTMTAGLVSHLLQVHRAGVSYTFDTHLGPNAWRRLCMYYDPAEMKVVAYIGDMRSEQMDNDEPVETTSDEMVVSDGLCLGSHDDSNPGINATIVAFSVQPWQQTGDDLIHFHPTDCTNLVTKESLLTNDYTWVSTGNVMLMDSQASEICEEAFTPIALQIFANHKRHFDICNRMAGRFVTENEIFDNFFASIAKVPDSCRANDSYKFWAGKNTTVSNLRTPCSLVVNGTLTALPCISEVQCSICLIPTSRRFNLYGSIENMDRAYTLKPDGETWFYLEGEDTSDIRYNGSSWVISSFLHSEQWHLPEVMLPIGRQLWYSSTSNQMLTITPCGSEGFSCSDGICVTNKDRCDEYNDCTDGSDEEQCNTLWVPKDYRTTTNPAHGKRALDFMYYDVTIFSIGNIETNSGTVKLDMKLDMFWYDYKVQYWNLKKHTQYVDCKAIWSPKLISLAGYKEGVAFDLDIYTEKCGLGETPYIKQHRSLDDPYMGKYLNGDEHYLFYSVDFKLDIPCNFNLQRYPFGSHFCNTSFQMINGQENMAFMKHYETEDVIEYTGNHDLLEYLLQKVTYETAHNEVDAIDYTYIVITLHLQSLYEYHLLNSFAPSALMFLISFASLFFAIEDFNERIMVSLTSLLVLAAFFTQASASSVKTPYYKLLDIWYVILIVLCFMAVIFNAIVDSLRLKNAVPITKVADINGWCDKILDHRLKKAAFCNLLAKLVLITLFVTLVTIYFLFGLDII